MTPEYGKVTTVDSYHEGNLSSTKHEVETTQFIEDNQLLKEVITSLGKVNKGETTNLTVNICVDKLGRMRLTTKWLA